MSYGDVLDIDPADARQESLIGENLFEEHVEPPLGGCFEVFGFVDLV